LEYFDYLLIENIDEINDDMKMNLYTNSKNVYKLFRYNSKILSCLDLSEQDEIINKNKEAKKEYKARFNKAKSAIRN